MRLFGLRSLNSMLTNPNTLSLVSQNMQLSLWFVVGVVVWLGFSKQYFSSLFTQPARQIGVLSCALIFTTLWQIRAGILPGLELHILGATAITLVIGWRFALLSAMLASLLLAIFSQLPISVFSLHLLFTGFLPILISYGIFVICYNLLPRHFFIYIFVCSFLCAALVSCLKIVSLSAFHYFNGTYDWYELSENYMYLCAIIWFPEAMLNGMAISLLITYRPHWVKTFYDKDYLDS